MIVVDTHVLVWWVNHPEKLSEKARGKMEKEQQEGTIFVSSITVWEIYLLVKKGRLQLKMETDTWLEKIESLSFIQFLAIDNKIAAKSVTIPGEFHGDPADRIIVATAREKGATLITADDRIRKYPHVQSLW